MYRLFVRFGDGLYNVIRTVDLLCEDNGFCIFRGFSVTGRLRKSIRSSFKRNTIIIIQHVLNTRNVAHVGHTVILYALVAVTSVDMQRRRSPERRLIPRDVHPRSLAYVRGGAVAYRRKFNRFLGRNTPLDSRVIKLNDPFIR